MKGGFLGDSMHHDTFPMVRRGCLQDPWLEYPLFQNYLIAEGDVIENNPFEGKNIHFGGD